MFPPLCGPSLKPLPSPWRGASATPCSGGAVSGWEWARGGGVDANPLKPPRGPHVALILARGRFWAGKGKHREEGLSPVPFVFGSH